MRIKLSCRSRDHTRSADFRVVLPWRDGLEPALARGWSPAGSGRLERKEVIACVVITRGGSPNGSRRVARRAAACSFITLRLGSTRSGLFQRRAWSLPGFVRSSGLELGCRGSAPLTRIDAGVYGLFFDRGWWWSWAFTSPTTGRRAEDGVLT